MGWQLHSLHFKQIFGDGYRYLDKAGEFMLGAKAGDFIPQEVKPTGGNMLIPELNLTAVVSTTDLVLRQESPGENVARFAEKAVWLATLAEKHFGPLDLQSNGVAAKLAWPCGSEEKVFELSMRFREKLQDTLSKELNMAPSATHLSFHFSSGKTDLHVKMEPAVFERAQQRPTIAPLRALRSQRERAHRQNKAVSEPVAAHVLLLEVDLIEFDPPGDGLRKHFDVLETKVQVLKAALTPS